MTNQSTRTPEESIWDALELHVLEAPEYFKMGLRAQDMLHAAAIGRSQVRQLQAERDKIAELEAELNFARSSLILALAALDKVDGK